MRPARPHSGFTLLEMSIVLTIIAVILGGLVVMTTASIQKKAIQETYDKQKAIQQALLNYRIAQARIPCPADVTQATTAAYFGTEAAGAGGCMGGTPAANSSHTNQTLTGDTTSGSAAIINMSATNLSMLGLAVTGSGIPAGAYIASVDSPTQITLSAAATATAGGDSLNLIDFVEGMVPTKALRLPDEYAFDGWGNRMMYAVDVRLTASNAFTNIPDNDQTTRMQIQDASDSVKNNRAIYVLLSFGPDGHGAYPRIGGSTRIFTGSTNTDEWQNCDCTATVATAFDGVFVQKMGTQNPANALDTFDDIVVYSTRSGMAAPSDGVCSTKPTISGGGFESAGVGR